MTALYLHIPFCRQKCLYCDFNSSSNLEKKKSYLEALKKEASLYKNQMEDVKISSIYLGGGTPSVLGQEDLEDLFLHIRETFDLGEVQEWTMEVNPESGKDLDFASLKNLGLSRVSMGIQTFHPESLASLGRIHSREDVYTSLKKIRQGGIKDINGDFMFSFPSQTLGNLEEDLKEIGTLGLSHISYYSFIPEEGTFLGDQVLEGTRGTIDESLDRKMEHRIEDQLKVLGYRQYELSNFTKDKPCIHNLAYWRIKDYLGLGLSAHSSLGDYRFFNTGDMEVYLEKLGRGQLPIEEREKISKEDRVLEYIIMGLRLNEGLNVSKIEDRFPLDFEGIFQGALEKNLEAKTLNYQDGAYVLTAYGRDVANQVELDFYRIEFDLS